MNPIIPLSLLLAVLNLCPSSFATIVPFEVRVNTPPSSSLSRRANSSIPISNTGNAQYIGNITVGGVEARVMLDTGSSDLWVAFPGNQPSSNNLGKSINLAYAVGTASGDVHSASVDFAGFQVQNQAFLLVTDTSTFSSDIHAQGYNGLLGLGPNKASVIHKTLNGNTGDTTLQHIFASNTSSQNYISFSLDRKNDPGNSFTGKLTISEVIPGFENITSMPKLDVNTVNRLLQADQHWQALTDTNVGIIGPDGQPIVVDSIVPNVPDGQFVAVFDSGFTFSQVPRQVSDAIYGRVQGASFDTQNQYWTVPCGQYLNISFGFGGRQYPIHPLDTVDDNFGKVDASGNHVCIGAFQPITSAFSILGNYDMIMGMSFLRNAYTLLDFGDWTHGAGTGNPYIQLSSMTNSVQAQNDFVQARFGGNNSLSDPKWALLPPSQMQHSPVSAAEKKKLYQEMILSRWPYILVGCLVFLLLLIGLCIWRCCCRKGAKGARANKSKKTKKPKNGLFDGEPASTSYLPLQEPDHSKGGYSSDARHDSSLYLSSQYSLDATYPADPHYAPPPRYSGPSSPPYGGHHEHA